MKITSLTNTKVKEIVRLLDKKNRMELRKFIVEGRNLVHEAKKHEILLETFALDESLEADYYVTEDVMKKMSDTKTPPSIIGVCKMKLNNTLGTKLIALENLQDPGNLGTIIRSAAAFGYDVVLENCADIFSPKVIRSTQGAIFKVGITFTNCLVEYLRTNNYNIYSTKVDGGTDVREFHPEGNYAVIIGNEGNGVTELSLDNSDEYIYIHMAEGVESLNAGVAASIIMERLR